MTIKSNVKIKMHPMPSLQRSGKASRLRGEDMKALPELALLQERAREMEVGI